MDIQANGSLIVALETDGHSACLLCTRTRAHTFFLFRMAAASAAFLLLHVVMARCVCRVRVVEVAAGLPLQLLVVVVVAVVAAAANAVVQLLHSLLPFCLSVAVCDRLQIPPRSSDLSQKLSRRLKKMPSLLRLQNVFLSLSLSLFLIYKFFPFTLYLLQQ